MYNIWSSYVTCINIILYNSTKYYYSNTEIKWTCDGPLVGLPIKSYICYTDFTIWYN